LSRSPADPEAELRPAFEDLAGAIAADPTFGEAWLTRGDAHIVAANLLRELGRDPLKHYEAAVEDLTRAMELCGPEDRIPLARANARASWGTLVMASRPRESQELLEGALADYDDALKRNPQNGLAFGNRGYLRGAMLDRMLRAKPVDRARVNEMDDAMESDFAEALRVFPASADTWFRRGRCRMIMSRWADAAGDFEEAVRRNPAYQSMANPLIEECRKRAIR